MNNQPLNLLTTNNTNNLNNNNGKQVTTVNENIAEDHSSLEHLGNQRQMALASLFTSLSSLANNQQQQPTFTSQHQAIVSNHHQQKQQISNAPQLAPTSSPLTSLPNPLQSVMAVAMMQQQLATAVSQHNQQQQQPQFFASSDQGNFFNQAIENDQANQQIGSQQQRINYCTICNKELCNKYFMKTHMLKMHGINLEMEQPDTEDDKNGEDDDDNVNDDDDDEDDDDRAERNKLDGDCVGRFGDDDDDDCSDGQQNERRQTNRDSWPSQQAGNNKNIQQQQQQQGSSVKKNSSQAASLGKSSLNNRKQSMTGTKPHQATSVMNGFAGNSMGGVVCDICNKELCSKYFLKVHKQNTHGIMTDYQDANQFIYPFANPMAGPNPFLTPATLAPPSPFTQNPMVLFAGTQTHQPQLQQQQQQCFEEPSMSKRSGGAKRLRLSQANKQSTSPPVVNIEKCDGRAPDPMANNNNNNNTQFDSVYRLILAQQQQQQSPQQHQQLPPNAAAATQPPPLIPMDHIGANPLGALMCFGALGPPGPFGPAAMSPAMIVDNILRNQHLFNRNNNNNSNAAMSQQVGANNNNNNNNNNKQTDRNNNKADGSLKQTGGKMSSGKESSSSASNSRYFSHYTEACPMCDRRFKSIKWLKTHMMNDHKQEIGAYMQMMMQYLYTSKSQQMAAAATMAAFEHQQHQQQQQQHQQDLISHFAKSQMQHNQPTSLLNKCFISNNNTFQQQQPSQMSIEHNQIKHHNNTFQNNSQQQQPKLSPKEESSHQDSFQLRLGNHLAGGNFVIDARFRQESLSPASGGGGSGSSINRQLSVSPTSARTHQMNFGGTLENHHNNNNNLTKSLATFRRATKEE